MAESETVLTPLPLAVKVFVKIKNMLLKLEKWVFRAFLSYGQERQEKSDSRLCKGLLLRVGMAIQVDLFPTSVCGVHEICTYENLKK